MSGSSVGAMVVGTVFILVFGMATVTMVESIDESVKNSEFELPDPQISLVLVTDSSTESPGPVKTLSLGTTEGTTYADGPVTCTTTAGAGTGLTVSVSAIAGAVTSASIVEPGIGYSVGTNTVTINDVSCGSGTATLDIDALHDQDQVTIKNIGSETVDLSHIFITFSDTATKAQGSPFIPFVTHYSGTNLYLFPGEQLSTDTFPLDPNTHGFAITDDPDRAFLAIYDYNDAETVTIT
ncbi:MAG TPA: hypothetical protein EYQ11_03255 [Candidatus Poseidoniales archaeon]|nr:hypothetical protein [Candidatus Poseidoniales archaeon]